MVLIEADVETKLLGAQIVNSDASCFEIRPCPLLSESHLSFAGHLNAISDASLKPSAQCRNRRAERTINRGADPLEPGMPIRQPA